MIDNADIEVEDLKDKKHIKESAISKLVRNMKSTIRSALNISIDHNKHSNRNFNKKKNDSMRGANSHDSRDDQRDMNTGRTDSRSNVSESNRYDRYDGSTTRHSTTYRNGQRSRDHESSRYGGNDAGHYRSNAERDQSHSRESRAHSEIHSTQAQQRIPSEMFNTRNGNMENHNNTDNRNPREQEYRNISGNTPGLQDVLKNFVMAISPML